MNKQPASNAARSVVSEIPTAFGNISNSALFRLLDRPEHIYQKSTDTEALLVAPPEFEGEKITLDALTIVQHLKRID